MKKIIYIILLLFSSLVINAQTTYTISNTDGGADYTTYSAMNAAVTLVGGDSVLARAGDIFREEVDITESGTSSSSMIYYGSYGDGPNPKILGSIAPADWTETGTSNVWLSGTTVGSITGRNLVNGCMYIYDSNDSILHLDEEQGSLGALTEDFEWYHTGSSVYLYSTSDPDTRFNGVELSQRATCMSFPGGQEYEWIEVNGLTLRFAINAGFSGNYPGTRGFEGLVFRNDTIGYIGPKGSPYSYGIEAYHANTLIENCFFSDNGRRGISWNTYITQDAGNEIVIENLIIRNNIFKRGYHTTSLDCSIQLSNSDTVNGVYFYNNIIDDSEISQEDTEIGDINGIFFQLGGGVAYMNNIYVVNNLWIETAYRHILYEGVDTSYTWNNTMAGFNPNITISPFAALAYNGVNGNHYYRNNILYDDIGQNSLDMHGILMYYPDANGTVFEEKDYNLYYSLNPGYGGDRNFSAHTPNSVGTTTGYWATDEWSSYLSDNSTAGFEANSPTPQLPDFVDYANKDYHLTAESPAVAAGLATDWIIVTDVFGVVDTINKYDVEGSAYSVGNWDLGAYAYSAVDSTATDILTFTITDQVSSVVTVADSSVVVTMPYGTDVTGLVPTITLSPLATVSPLSGVSQNFTSEVAYTVTSNKLNDQEWGCSVIVEAAPPTPPSVYNVKRVKFGKRRVINGSYIIFNK